MFFANNTRGMTKDEKEALEYLNKKQNEENIFTNIGPDEIRRAVEFLKGGKK